MSNQDAFALNPMARRFSVADGMGGYGADKTGTAFMARFVAAYAAEVGIADFKDPTKLPEVYRKAQSGFRHVSGREFEMPRLKGSGIGTVGTTLSYAEVLDATHVRIMAIGDSPIFVLDEELAPIAQYGEDSQSGRFDQPLAFKLGIDAGGAPLIPQFDAKAPDGRSIVDMTLEIPPNQYLALATDYFSEQNASRHIGELSGSTASAYDKHVSSYGKSDDATLIIIKPSALF
ncbi:hypothetical protein IU429_02880 [Nocardia elegans]|nr:hypothetical protein [Nocardia elegans]